MLDQYDPPFSWDGNVRRIDLLGLMMVFGAACAFGVYADTDIDASAHREPFRVLQSGKSPTPRDGQRDVSRQAVVRVQFSKPINPKTLTASAMQLFGPNGKPVPAYLQTDLTGGVATLTPTLLLEPEKFYTVRLAASIKDIKGVRLTPFTSRFKTSGRRPKVNRRFIFTRRKIEARDHNSCITIGPDGNLYVADTFGHIKRYRLDPKSGLAIDSDTAYHAKGDQIVDLLFDPEASAQNLTAWISYGRYGQQFGGAIARIQMQPFGSNKQAAKQDIIVGLPHDKLLHHQPNGMAFGPNGRLYQTIGGVTTLGGTPNWGMKETPLTAAVIVADVRHKHFSGGRIPCNVQTSAPTRYDPNRKNAPVRIFATGFRNAYALCWHSSGHLFTATNQNSIGHVPKTPADPVRKIPAINASPDEMLYRVIEGKYYGHPNPARHEFVLNGGNPTDKYDPFEVAEYPAGTPPHPKFDPSLIYNLRPGGGHSANGIDEYPADGPLKGRLLIAYFSGAKTIQTFAIDRPGHIRHEHALMDRKGNPHRFAGALDVAVHPKTGRVYIADFGTWKRPNFGVDGAVWMLEPIPPVK